ncbi:scabin-related ADP-ribosyltransferase [Microbacterium tumbae]
MSAIKPIIREVKQSVLKGFAHAKDKLHQVADNLSNHVDDVVKKVKGQDHFDQPALTGNVTTRVDRTTSQPLYRSDDRPPSEIFQDGFQVRDPSNNDLDNFVRTNAPSNFVSTTKDPNLYQRWGSDYRYTVDAPGGIDVDATMPNGPYNPSSAAPEFEIAFQGGVPAENVVGAHPVLPGGGLGDWVPNPNYSGGK